MKMENIQQAILIDMELMDIETIRKKYLKAKKKVHTKNKISHIGLVLYKTHLVKL